MLEELVIDLNLHHDGNYDCHDFDDSEDDLIWTNEVIIITIIIIIIIIILVIIAIVIQIIILIIIAITILIMREMI